MTSLPDRRADGTYLTSTHWGRFRVRVEHGRVTSMTPADDPEPATIGYRAASYDQLRARVLHPMVRTGYLRDGAAAAPRRGEDTFTRVSWDEALDLVAAELGRVYEESGPSAVYGGSYGWASAGRFHHAQSQIHRFLNAAGGYTPSTGTYSYAAMARIVPHILGISAEEHMLMQPSWQDIADEVDLVLAFGGLPLRNSQVNPGGVYAHSAGAGQQLCAGAGTEFINVSPQRSDLEVDGVEWIPVRPGTDTALMLAIVTEVVGSGRHDMDFLQRCCVGFEELMAYLTGGSDGVAKDADWAARICDVDAETVRRLADLVVQRRTLITVSWSIQRASHGEQAYWAAVALAAVAGQLGRGSAGVALGFGTHHSTGTAQRRLPIAALGQRVRELSDPPVAIPVSRLADMLTSPGRVIDFDGQRIRYPHIDLVYWCGGNPFHHHQDLNRLAEAWQRPRTIVVHEAFWTATAKHADIVLPASTYLERNDFAAGRFEQQLSVMEAVLACPGEALDDYEIFSRLAGRLGVATEFTEGRTADEWVRHLYDVTRENLASIDASIPDFDVFWAVGEAVIEPAESATTHVLAELRRDPQGSPLPTPSGRVQLFSQAVADFGYDDCPGHPMWLEPDEWLGSGAATSQRLHLLSPQPKARLHSQYDQADHSQDTKVAGREPLVMHPADAAERGISSGDVVRVFNERGECLAGAVLSDGVRKKVVVLATGAWYDPVRPGGLDRHGNPNVLTADRGTSKLAQGPSSGTVLVEVERYAAAAPEVRAFESPATA